MNAPKLVDGSDGSLHLVCAVSIILRRNIGFEGELCRFVVYPKNKQQEKNAASFSLFFRTW